MKEIKLYKSRRNFGIYHSIKNLDKDAASWNFYDQFLKKVGTGPARDQILVAD